MTVNIFSHIADLKNLIKKINPCTNRIDRCPIKGCLSNVWLYCFQFHFDEKHNGEDFPEEMIIAEEERKWLW